MVESTVAVILGKILHGYKELFCSVSVSAQKDVITKMQMVVDALGDE